MIAGVNRMTTTHAEVYPMCLCMFAYLVRTGYLEDVLDPVIPDASL
jgi:hypothetical protein